jgi:Na+/proline symporter
MMTILQNIDPLWICLGLYLAFTITATAGIDNRYKTTTQGFWVSGRMAPTWLVATSAASSWLWVLGLLFIGRFSFQNGPPGVFWSYGLPFLAASAMFGYFGKILLEKFPQGFTLNSFIQHRYQNKKLTILYQVLQVAACVYAVSSTLTSFGIVAACHRTDVLNMIFLLFISLFASFYIVVSSGGFATVVDNWTTARPTSLFDPGLMWSKGMFLLLIFVGSFFADNMQYQNVFALGDKTKTIRTYWLASAILVFVVAGMSLITGSVFTTNPEIDINPDVIQMYMMKETFGLTGVIFFMLTILFKASSVIDSTLNGAGTVISNDIIKRSNPITVSRWAMVVVMLLSTMIAIFRIDIWVLISTFGLLRIIMLAPTLYALLSTKKIPTNLIFYTLVAITILGIGSTFTTLPIDRAGLGLVLFLIPTAVIGYVHYKK